VHNAPGFGEDDYLACKRYGINPFSPIDDYGKFTNEISDKDIVGIFYDTANKIISDKLDKAKALLKLSFITHTAAHD
jgi:isoleucyl-tRNA synthetase